MILPPAKLRAALAEHRLRLYELAPTVRIHPTRLGAMLNEKVAMLPAVALRLMQAIEESGASD